MSLLVRLASPCSREFLTRPNTYSLKFPTGSDFYFSMPFDMDWLRSLRPIELAALREYLSNILGDIANRMGHIGMYSVHDVQHGISVRLSSTDQLTEIEYGAWAAGHGFPMFDSSHRLNTFFWDWNVIHFECGPSVVAWYVRQLYDFQHKPGFERYAVRRSMRFEENKIGYHWWFEDGQLIIKWYCNSEMVCVKKYGAAFRDFDEWRALKTQLESYELDMLKKGTARLRNARNGGWELVVYSNERRSGTSSDNSSLEYAYEPYPSTADSYFYQIHHPEEIVYSGLNLWDPCYGRRQAPSPSPREQIAERIQNLDTCSPQLSSPLHSVPSHPSELLHQANDLAKTVKDLEARLFHIDKTQPSPQTPTLPITPLPRYSPAPYYKHKIPSTPHLRAQTAIFPVTTIRDESTPTPTQQLYQAYAEDDNDDCTKGGSVHAAPNSWRDV